MQIDIIRTEAGLHQLEGDWRALEASARFRVPFQTFDWNAAWWRAMHEDKLGVRDELALRALRDGGRLVAVAPLVLTSRPGRGPLRARTLQFFGADPNITELRGLAVAPEDADAAWDALIAHVQAGADGWDAMNWDGVRAGSPAAARLEALPGFAWKRDIPSFELPLQGTWEEMKSAFPRNLKESLRKCYNSLKRDSLEFELQVSSTWEQIQPALDTFLELHTRRAQHEEGVRHGNVFEAPAARRFLLDVSERFARRGAMRVFGLRIQGRIVATRLAFVLGDTLYLFYSGFDPEYGKYSVMTTCVAEAIQHAAQNGFKRVHLSTGSDQSKLRWRPEETIIRSGSQVSPTRRGQLADQGVKLAVRAMELPVAGVLRRFLLRRS